VITDPRLPAGAVALTGHDMADDVELMPVTPFYRLNWPDGVNFDYSNNEAALAARSGADLARGP
jgi:phytoene desaturase